MFSSRQDGQDGRPLWGGDFRRKLTATAHLPELLKHCLVRLGSPVGYDITTICPRGQTGHSRKDFPVSFS